MATSKSTRKEELEKACRTENGNHLPYPHIANRQERAQSLDRIGNWRVDKLGEKKRNISYQNSRPGMDRQCYPRHEQNRQGFHGQGPSRQGYSKQEHSMTRGHGSHGHTPHWQGPHRQGRPRQGPPENPMQEFLHSDSSSKGPSAMKNYSIPFQQYHSGSKNELRNRSSLNSRPSKFGFNRLQQLAKKDSDEIVVELTNTKNDFFDLLKTELSSDKIMLLAEILAKMTASKMLENKCSLFTKVFQPEFLKIFSEHSGNIYAKDLRYSDAAVISYFQSLQIFFNDCMEILPNSAGDYLKEHLKKTIMGLQSLKMFKQLHVSEELENSFTNLLTNLASLESSGKKIAPQRSKRFQNLEWKPPGTDFREVNPYPVPKDLLVKSELQLSPVVVEGPYKSVEHYLNVQFYLLREDFIIPLRNGVLNFYELKSANKSTSRQTENVRFYRDVQFISQFVDGNMLVSEVFFDPKGKYGNMNWKSSKKFMYGSLVCFSCDSFKSLFIGVIVNRDIDLLKKGILRCELMGEVEERNLFGKKFIMAESEVYFEAYFHVLNALKTYNETNFPLKEYIINVSSEITLPSYLAAHINAWYDFNGFDFQVVAKGTWPSKKSLKVNDSQFEALYSALTQKLAIIQGPPGTGKTYLGLIIARILIENKRFWVNRESGPILVVCYTNHALDQFLEGILNFTTKVVRVGGQSKNEKITPYNLKNHRRDRFASQALSNLECDLKDCADDIFSLNCFLQELKYRPGIISVCILQPYMSARHSSWFHEQDSLLVEWLLEGAFENQITDVVMPNPPCPYVKSNYAITLEQLLSDVAYCDLEIGKAAGEDLEYLLQMRQLFASRLSYCKIKLMEASDWNDDLILQLNEVSNLSQLDPDERWILYNYWISKVIKNHDEQMTICRERHSSYAKMKSEMTDRIHLKIMMEADFVGMTTTGAARLQGLLKELGARVVIVEEAAEVMESHVIVSLSDKCEHLILIGDHKQLRPSPAVYKLAKEYNFDVSLFERMLRNNVPYKTLDIQHRMRPEIADLIIPSVYPTLENHETVLNYGHILGMERNLFFINHSNPEEQAEFCLSKRNVAEADFLIAFCRHIILQGYNPSQITILTFYLGQMFTLNEEKEKHAIMADVRITCVDNYQGEENDIILLSLVRSNEEGKIGFVASENRICVALSRAKKALFAIGNMELLASKSTLWKKVVEVLKKKGAIGNKLKLKCVKHPEQLTEVCKREDFVPLTEGGCTLMCNTELNCGHICKKICHMNSHDSYQCKEICGKDMCIYGHKCAKICFENCGECMVPLLSELPCGHWANIPCYIDPLEYRCQVLVKVILQACGHEITKRCFEHEARIKCSWDCDSRLPCGHACELKCHVNDDPDHYKYKCLRPCGRKNVNCNEEHLCEKKCFEECSHCTFKVKRKLPNCDHYLSMECSTDASSIICFKKCKKILECKHPCPLKCYENCGGCKVMVKKTIEECNHEVKIECCQAPERHLCKRKCERLLSCGHICGKLCGEPCQPSACKVVLEKSADSPCGHKVRLYCHERMLGVVTSSLPSRCSEPCTKTLLCDHVCRGTCSSCLQGRIHIQCQDKCGRNLVCGHQCKVSCSQSCPPCKEQCFVQCEHSKCRKKCGQPCVPCREPCSWRCKHYGCKKPCGQMCDRPPCDEPCEKKLHCGHPCIGLCGEICPPLCRECDSTKLDEISMFLPSEDDNPRFLLLPDCKHIFDVKGLDKWLTMNTDSIKMISCPQCTTPIQNAKRYGNIMKKHFRDVSKVKTKVFGDLKKGRAVVSTSFKKLLTATKTLEVKYSSTPLFKTLESLMKKVSMKVNQRAPLNAFEVNSLQARIQFTTLLLDCFKSLSSVTLQLDSDTLTHFTYATELIKIILGNLELISSQQHSDFSNECLRFQLRMQLCIIQNMPQFKYLSNSPSLNTYKECETLITSLKPFQPDLYDETHQKLEQLRKTLGSPVGISKLEIARIVNAINLHQGHWYACPNGHVYVIGDCGGAAVESRCNECGERIGGGGHRLLPTNTRLSSTPNGL